MVRSFTSKKVVLDTSIVAKSIMAPPRYLPKDIYEREIKTREKIRVILSLLENSGSKVFFPKAGIIEVVSVLKRGGMSKEHVLRVVESLNATFVVVDESVIYEKALEAALATAPSGFDTYFIALALLTDSLLITDDKGMADHARRLNIDSILVREATIEEIRAKLLS